ncbi:MAG: MFS transporter [Thermomicrobiales bacterium]
MPISTEISDDAAPTGVTPRSVSRQQHEHTAAAGRSIASNPDFRCFWTAEAISQVGSQFTEVALPLLAALSLGATPVAVGALAAATGLPHLLFGLLAGAWLDRLRRKPVMIAADLGRAALLLVIPVAAWLGVLGMPLLIVVAFLLQTLTLFFDIAYLSYLPSLVPRSDLVAANSRLEATASSARVVGPALAGGVVRLVGAPLAIVVDAASYLGSAVFLWRIEAPEAPPTPSRQSMRADIAQGLQAVWTAPVLRALALSSAIVNLAGFLFLSIYILYMTRDLGLGAEAVGLVFAAGGVGALLGSIAAGPARDRFGIGTALVGSQILFGLTGMLVPLAVLFPRWAVLLVVGAEFLQWLMVLVYDVNAVSLRQAVTPDHLLGRVNGTMRFLIWGTRPLGSLAGGYLGSRIGLPMTLVVGAFGMLIAFLPLLASPIPKLRSLNDVSVMGTA